MFLKYFSIVLIASYSILIIVSCTNSESAKKVFAVELTPDNFDNAIRKNNHLVMFYETESENCEKLNPLWEQLAEIMNIKDEPRVIVSKVDCTAYSELCSKQDITVYPTLKFFKLGSNEPKKFKGTKDLPAITDFIQEQLGDKDAIEILLPTNKLTELTDDTFAKHVAKGKHFVKFYAPWCGHCQKLAPTWEELAKSLEYDDSVKISKIDCTVYRPICQDFEVKGYPTLLWIEDGKKIEKHSGSRSLNDLKAYVEKKAKGEDQSQKLTDDKKDEDIKSKGDSSVVLQLTGDNFHHGIEKGVSFVKFYAPWCGHCQKLSPVWEQLAVKMINKPKIKIAKIDCTLSQNKNLCSDQQIEGYPTLFIYKNGEKLEEYNGSRQLDDLYSFATSYLEHDEL